MAYAPLFHEVHSEFFLALCRTINAIAAGTRMTRADILQQLPNLDWGGLERANALIDTLIDRGMDVSVVYDGENLSFKEHVVLNEDLNKLFLV